jgi:hypothetical protein
VTAAESKESASRLPEEGEKATNEALQEYAKQNSDALGILDSKQLSLPSNGKGDFKKWLEVKRKVREWNHFHNQLGKEPRLVLVDKEGKFVPMSGPHFGLFANSYKDKNNRDEIDAQTGLPVSAAVLRGLGSRIIVYEGNERNDGKGDKGKGKIGQFQGRLMPLKSAQMLSGKETVPEGIIPNTQPDYTFQMDEVLAHFFDGRNFDGYAAPSWNEGTYTDVLTRVLTGSKSKALRSIGSGKTSAVLWMKVNLPRINGEHLGAVAQRMVRPKGTAFDQALAKLFNLSAFGLGTEELESLIGVNIRNIISLLSAHGKTLRDDLAPVSKSLRFPQFELGANEEVPLRDDARRMIVDGDAWMDEQDPLSVPRQNRALGTVYPEFLADQFEQVTMYRIAPDGSLEKRHVFSAPEFHALAAHSREFARTLVKPKVQMLSELLRILASAGEVIEGGGHFIGLTHYLRSTFGPQDSIVERLDAFQRTNKRYGYPSDNYEGEISKAIQDGNSVRASTTAQFISMLKEEEARSKELRARERREAQERFFSFPSRPSFNRSEVSRITLPPTLSAREDTQRSPRGAPGPDETSNVVSNVVLANSISDLETLYPPAKVEEALKVLETSEPEYVDVIRTFKDNPKSTKDLALKYNIARETVLKWRNRGMVLLKDVLEKGKNRPDSIIDQLTEKRIQATNSLSELDALIEEISPGPEGGLKNIYEEAKATFQVTNEDDWNLLQQTGDGSTAFERYLALDALRKELLKRAAWSVSSPITSQSASH